MPRVFTRGIFDCLLFVWETTYIIPIPPPGITPPPAGAPFFSGLSATRHSVVMTNAAIDAAFCNAARVTFAGSMMPAFTRSTYSPVAALRPTEPF